MSDLVITIKEGSQLYNELKANNVLDEEAIKNKIATCLEVEDMLYESCEECLGYIRPELFKQDIAKLKDKELNEEIIKKLELASDTIYHIIDSIEDKFFKIKQMGSRDFVFLDTYHGFPSLKYVGEILPIMIEKLKNEKGIEK